MGYIIYVETSVCTCVYVVNTCEYVMEMEFLLSKNSRNLQGVVNSYLSYILGTVLSRYICVKGNMYYLNSLRRSLR